MGYSDAVGWWQEWQLQVLVLASLFLQYFLFIAAALRKRRVPPWFKFITWLAYLGSDAVAIYALATLFNRNKKQEWVSEHRSSASLQVLWAPILLLHFGGQDGITAYNIEDNELWRRHVLTAVSQIAVALYVFRKSWPGEKRLLQAVIVSFVPGILKCLEKPWALKNASINSIDEQSEQGVTERMERTISFDEFVQAASTHVQGGQPNDDEQSEQGVIDKPYKLFVDLAYSYSDRLKNLKYMVQGGKRKAHRRVRNRLSMTFDRLYTKYAVYKGLDILGFRSWKRYWGNQLRIMVIYMTFAAIALFHWSRREAYDSTDIKITYTLLCCTAALEFISTGLRPLFEKARPWGWASGAAAPGHQSPIASSPGHRILTAGEEWALKNFDWFHKEGGRQPWPEQVAQYNLVGYLARNRKRTWLRRLATMLLCKGYLDQLWCMTPCKSSSDITELVYNHVIDGWNNCVNDTISYRRFNDNRGQRTLQREGCGGGGDGTSLEWSLRRPFDESVLLWHLATDLCFHHMDRDNNPYIVSHRSRAMSNYMVYLLFVNPEMLMTGARRRLFRDTYRELKEMVKENTPLNEEELVEKIIEKVSSTEGSGFVHQAWVLAKELLRVGKVGVEEEKRMWRVIQGVWVEMMCFSAGRCRGYLHAKSLGMGGEYLSYVWLLLSYMGMETLAERLQRTELNEEGDMGAAGLTSASMVPATGSENA